MPNARDLEVEFNYDLWANKRWLECLSQKANAQVEMDQLGHLFSATTIWLKRCQGESPTKMPDVERSFEAIEELHRGWIQALNLIDAGEVIHYRRTTGEEMHSTFIDIARHVINHGTYHRGELRGLCRAKHDTDFPETDRILFTLMGE